MNEKKYNNESYSNQEHSELLELKRQIEKMQDRLNNTSLAKKNIIEEDILDLSRKLDDIILKSNI